MDLADEGGDHMWTRAQLKERAKAALHRNYWKVVLVALLAGFLGTGGFSSGSSIGSSATDGIVSNRIDNAMDHALGWDSDDDYSYDDTDDWDEEDDTSSAADFAKGFADGFGAELASVLVFLLTFLIVMIAAVAIAFVVDAFLINPLDVGSKRFFFYNLNAPAEVRELMFGFDHAYMNIVKTMFFRELSIFLWSLLFIIPGIVKSYEYRMIPYLLAEYPDMPKEQAFETSKRMMNGQKWRTFVLDLSFLGWNILSALTLEILGIFYVRPYKNMTDAALYESLKYRQQN